MSRKKRFVFLISLFVMVLAVSLFLNTFYYPQRSGVLSKINLSVLQPSKTINITPPPTLVKNTPEINDDIPLPDSFLIDNFSFASQAPLGNWDELHDEACEEAALILVKYYLDNQDINSEVMEDEILKMVTWEISYFGSHKDLTIEELSDVATKYYNLNNYDILPISSIDDIKKEIIKNHPVIIPTAGRLLGNPYFRQPGPIYHMLVVIGFNDNNIIVQDIGTKRGDHFTYNEKILLNAIHDWTGNFDNIENGQKVMLVFN